MRMNTWAARVASLALLCISGCAVNLPTVRDFSQITAAATASFKSMADDIPQSCIRRVDISYEPSDKVTVENSRVEYTSEYRDALDKCEALNDSLNGILDVNDVLKAYAEALGTLASDEAITFTQEEDALQASLNQINVNGKNPFSGAKAAAVSDLARFLSNAALDGYRQRKLRDAIQIGNDHLDPIIGGLTDVAGDYQVLLRNEKQNLITNQNVLIAQRKNLKSATNTDQQLLDIKQAADVIDAKDQAAEGYKTVLKKISDAHHALYVSSQSKELESALLVTEMQQYSTELTPLINQMRTAFKK